MKRETPGLQILDQQLPGWLNRVDVVIILLVLVVMISYQLAPSIIEQGRDSGIFAYTGEVIRLGGLPYRDAWDNKPPGVYYLNAFAFILFGPNRWALWLIETISVFLTGLVMFMLLSRVYHTRRDLAWAGTIALILLSRHPALVSDTNFTEVYALLPQVACFAAGYQFLRQPRYRWGFLIGLSVGFAFMFKQTTVGVAVAFIPALLLSRHPVAHMPNRWKLLGSIILGGLSVLGAVALYLLINGVLLEAIDAAFIAPLAFHRWVSKGLTQAPVTLWGTLYNTLTASKIPVVLGPLLPFWVAGLVIAWRRTRAVWRAHPHPRRHTEVTLTTWAALTFLTDLVLTNPTSRGYGHYYVTLLPGLTLLLVLAVSTLPHLPSRASRAMRLRRAVLYLWLAAAVGGGAVGGMFYRFYTVDWQVAGPTRLESLTTYVIEHTRPEDTVLVWGATTAINFQSERLSPTQYHYGYPLIVPDYVTKEEIQEIVTDLETSRPVLILDSTLVDGDRIPPLDAIRRQQWWERGGRRDVINLGPVYLFVEQHCTEVDVIEQTAIYRCRYSN